MESTQELVQQTRGTKEGNDGRTNEDVDNDYTSIATNNTTNLKLPKLKRYTKWLRIAFYILCLLVGQTSGVLLGRLYYDKGGNSKWLATLVQNAGFPLLIPLKLYLCTTSHTTTKLPIYSLILLYFGYGVMMAVDNYLYSYGLLLIPVSTYSLLCATQLAFNAVTSFFINAQKITALVLNSVVILTISACLLAINANDEGSNNNNHITRRKYIIGFFCTIGASAICALMLSLIQFSFQKVLKDESFNTVVGMLFYPSFVASCVGVVGLFGSGEWRALKGEISTFKMGRVTCVMVLAFAAISWQVGIIGLLGLIFEVSSLFSNVISTLSLPLIPVFAVVFFHDKMNGIKVISLVLAMWGFLSYIYQHYLDNIEATSKATKQNGNESLSSTEMC